MRAIFVIGLLVCLNSTFCQSRLDGLIKQLYSREFTDVYLAKDSIVNYQMEAIPRLVAMLADSSFCKLQNTGDLIYPGAEKYYGHGWIVSYDIDWVCVRAAWILEEITFQNFGYRDMSISEEKLKDIHKKNYRDYMKTGSHKVNFKDQDPFHLLLFKRAMLADSVSKWWENNKTGWTRLSALKKALSSSDVLRQEDALHYLRFDKSICDGLTLEYYKTELLTLVQKIFNANNEQSDQAKYLIDDHTNEWFKGKSTTSHH